MLGGYHFYLIKKGVFEPHIKGIYTVNLNESINALKKDILTRTLKGEKVDPDKELLKIQLALDKLARNLPSGYLLLPDSMVLGGQRRKINLITGKISSESMPGGLQNLHQKAHNSQKNSYTWRK